jgi:hypothetical protein
LFVPTNMSSKFLIGVLAALCCALAHAQYSSVGPRAYDPNSPTHTVSGSVVNSATGEGIPRALVQLMGPLQRSDLTDSQGSFRFEGVPEGRAMFMTRKPGFFSSEELSRGGGRPRAPMMITGDVSSLVLKLAPEGIVAGIVTGDDGEPLEGVRLWLKRQVINNGRKQWETRGQSTTNDIGEFRVADLIPGTYYMVAQAQRPSTPRAAAEPNLGYAPSYYPGTPDLASASAIDVRGGQAVQFEFRLRAQPVYEVAGFVTGMAPEQRGGNLEFLNRSGDPLAANVRFNPDDASFSARLPAGTYTVRARSFNRQGPPATASATITVTASVSGIRLPLLPGATIPVVVRTEFTNQPSSANVAGGSGTVGSTGKPPQYASVQLTGLDGAASVFSNYDAADNNAPLALHNVEPGRYTVQISPRGPWYVQSAAHGQTDVLREDLVVAQGDASPIEIVLRDDGGSVSGSATADNVAVPAVVLVVPARRSTAPQTQYASERGFTINTLAPGDYLLFAFDSVDGLEFANREALEPYASRATRVTVNSKGNATVTLTLIKRGEP